MRIIIPIAALVLAAGGLSSPAAASHHTAVNLSPAAPTTTAATAVNLSPAAATDAYWTPERLAAAKPAPYLGDSAGSAKGLEGSAGPARAEAPGDARFVHATPPAGVHTAASEWVTNGRLVFTNPGVGDFICSANVVSSNNHDVIATARHCVADVGAGKVFQNFRFAPAYNRGNAPYGWWSWRSAGWRIDDTGPGGDNAFIVLNRGGNANAHVQDVVGGSGIGFNWATNGYAHAIGTPGATDYAVWCEGQPYDGPSGGVQIRNCNGLSGGASGGSFIVNYQADGSAVQTASYFGSWGDSYFAYYRDVAWTVYNGAQNA